MSLESKTDAAATEGCAPAAGYVACRIYADTEKDALMQALFNLSEADKDGAPYPADDMISVKDHSPIGAVGASNTEPNSAAPIG